MEPGSIIEKMMGQDLFSQWLNIEILETGTGYCKLQMMVRPEMCNGFHITHGGITYSLADSALAFASNSHGRQALSIETSISHLKAVFAGEILIAEAIEKNLSYKIGLYEVTICNQRGEMVAIFKGTVYRKNEILEL